MKLARFLALQTAIGFIAAGVFVATLLLADPGGIGALLHPGRSGPLPLALLWLFSGLTFTGAQFATAMALGAEPGPGGGKSRLSAAPRAALRPALVPAPARVLRRPRSPSP